MPHFEKVVNDISSIFIHVSMSRGNFSFHDKFHTEFIRMLEECDCYDYIFFSICKLLDVFLDQYQLDTFFQEPLFQSVHHTKDLISYASPEKLRVLKELLFQQTQTFFINFVNDSYQQLIPPISVFLAIFHVLKCVFLIFRDFQFSRHIPGPSVCISHFSRFLVISSFFKSSSGCFSFSMIFTFLAIFHVLEWIFLNFPPFSVFLAIFHVLKCEFLIFRDFQFSHHIPGPTVCIFIFHVFQ